MRLLSDEEESVGTNGDVGNNACPAYVRAVEALSMQLEALEGEVASLEALLKHKVERPLFDDDDSVSADDREAEQVTQRVQAAVRAAHRDLGRIREGIVGLDGLESVLARNMVAALTNRLKDAMEKFGVAQSVHLKSRFIVGSNFCYCV